MDAIKNATQQIRSQKDLGKAKKMAEEVGQASGIGKEQLQQVTSQNSPQEIANKLEEVTGSKKGGGAGGAGAPAGGGAAGGAAKAGGCSAGGCSKGGGCGGGCGGACGGCCGKGGQCVNGNCCPPSGFDGAATGGAGTNTAIQGDNNKVHNGDIINNYYNGSGPDDVNKTDQSSGLEGAEKVDAASDTSTDTSASTDTSTSTDSAPAVDSAPAADSAPAVNDAPAVEAAPPAAEAAPAPEPVQQSAPAN